MKKDRIFRKSFFGGFNREDVLGYIDEIKSETVAEKDKNKALCDKCDTLNSTIDGLENEIRQADSREKKLLNDLSDKNDEVLALTKKIAELEAKVETLEQDSKKYKQLESQVGSMIIDARCYSDKVIENAKDKVNEISSEYCETVNDISREIGDASDGVKGVSEKVNGVITTVIDKLSKLAEHLKSTQELIVKANDEFVSEADTVKNDTYDEIIAPKQAIEVDVNPNVFEFHQPSDDDLNNFTNEYGGDSEEDDAPMPHFSVNVSAIDDDIDSFYPVTAGYGSADSGAFGSVYNGFIN